MQRRVEFSEDVFPAGLSLAETYFSQERHRLAEEFLEAVHELNTIQSQQVRAVIEGDPDFSRFDILLHFAQQKKENAKYAWIGHVEKLRRCWSLSGGE